ncbi:c1q globular head like domain containing protein [Ochrobactrum phage vB_OspM_OC]|nr:c1q globular head like domain containing protein [Ochrobactrum phage vB_OspM_OC]
MATNTFKRYFAKNVGTTQTNVGTAIPTGTQATIIGLSVCNVADAQVQVDIGVKITDGTVYYIVKNAPLLIGSTLVAVGGDQKIVLQAGDQIVVKSTNDLSLDVIVSVLEIAG